MNQKNRNAIPKLRIKQLFKIKLKDKKCNFNYKKLYRKCIKKWILGRLIIFYRVS